MTNPQTTQPKPKRPGLARHQQKRVKQLVEDEGYSRKEAIAWVLIFEADQ